MLDWKPGLSRPATPDKLHTVEHRLIVYNTLLGYIKPQETSSVLVTGRNERCGSTLHAVDCNDLLPRTLTPVGLESSRCRKATASFEVQSRKILVRLRML